MHPGARVVVLALAAAVLSVPGAVTGAVTGAPPQRPACELTNGPGVSDDTLELGNVSDISGPFPGLHQSAQDAVVAYVAHFNEHHDICGRKLELKLYDSKTDAGADRRASLDACRDVFATVGSSSDLDLGGARATARCGLPDLRAASRSGRRRACRTCLTTHPDHPRAIQDVLPRLLRRSYGGGTHDALVYLDVGENARRATLRVRAQRTLGLRFSYVVGIPPQEFDYAPYAQQLKDQGVQTVQLLSSQTYVITRLAEAMRAAGFHPRAYVVDPVAYSDPGFASHGVRTLVALDSWPFAAADPPRELQLYLSSLRRSRPGATPTVEGLYAWSAARLFTDTALELGSDLTRRSLVRRLRQVDGWTGHGLHAPQHVGSGRLGGCLLLVVHRARRWVPVGGPSYRCGGITRAS